MAVNESTGLKTSKAGLIPTVFPAGAKMDFFTGGRPANAQAAPTGTLVGTVTLPATPWGAEANGSIQKNGTWSFTAIASGVAGWARLRQAADAGAISTTLPRIDFSVAMDGSGDVNLDNTNIAVNQIATITGVTVNG